jgi:ABC-type nitrate/sulfonate/bicarbonate transport system permease component
MSTSVLIRPDAVPPRPAAPPRRTGAQARRIAVSLAGVVGFLLLWLVLGATGVLDPNAIPGLPDTVAALGRELVSGAFWAALGATLSGWGLGLLLGVVAGLLLGTLIGLSSVLQISTAVVVEFLKTVPIIAILPLAILVLGTSLTMKVSLVAFGVLWPLLVQTMYGVRAMDPVIRDTATAMGIGPVRRFFVVVLPSAAPYIATGLRVAASGALILTVVVELIAGGSGLGVEISRAAISGAPALPAMYARIVVAGILGFLMATLLTRLERRVLRWHEAYRPGGTA